MSEATGRADRIHVRVVDEHGNVTLEAAERLAVDELPDWCVGDQE